MAIGIDQSQVPPRLDKDIIDQNSSPHFGENNASGRKKTMKKMQSESQSKFKNASGNVTDSNVESKDMTEGES